MRLLILCCHFLALHLLAFADPNANKACRIKGECYLFVNKALPWTMARQVCQQKNGLLTPAQGPDKNEWIVARLKQYQMLSSFLGIRYEPEQQNFVTINGSIPTFMNNQIPFRVVVDSNNKGSKAILKRRKRYIRQTYHRRTYKRYYRKRTYRRYYRKRTYRRYYRKRTYRRRYYRRYYRRRTSRYWRRYRRTRIVIRRFHYRKWWAKYQRRKRRRMKRMLRIRIKRLRLMRRRKMRILNFWKKVLVWLKKVHWETWIKTISGINSRVWIKRIKRIEYLVIKRQVKQVKFTWKLWYRELLGWYKDWIKKYTGHQTRMIWRWRKFVQWLVRIEWRKVIIKVEGIDTKLWESRLARIIFIMTNLKYTEICDKKWYQWKAKIEPWLRLMHRQRTRLMKNDKKTKALLLWSKRLQWIKKHKVITYIKFGEKFAKWRQEALTIVQRIIRAQQKLDIRVLQEKSVLAKWHRIKKLVQQEVTGITTTTSTKTTIGVTKYIKWVNRYSWLKTNNIDFVIKQKASRSLKKCLDNLGGMLKESHFEVKSEREIRRNFKKLQVVIQTQQTIVKRRIHEFTIQKRSVPSQKVYSGIPEYIGAGKLDLGNSMHYLQTNLGQFPLLEKFLRSSVLRLFYLASRIHSNNDDLLPPPSNVMFEKLINEELHKLHQVGLPKQLWSFIGALNLPGVQIILNNQSCVSMTHLKVGDAQKWVQTSCNKPQPFVCALSQ